MLALMLSSNGRLVAWPPTTMSVLFETSLGDLVIDLETDTCPKTCENFLKLCKVYYYNLNASFNGAYQPPFRARVPYTQT